MSSPIWFNVRDYGALGNGNTPDTTAFQAALNAAIGAGGGTVYVPIGAYPITDTLYLNNAKGIEILGEGDDSYLAFDVAGAGISIGNSTGVSIRHLRFDGHSVAMIVLGASHHCSVSSCSISGATLPSQGGTLDTAGILLSDVSEVSILNNVLSGNGFARESGDIMTYDGTLANSRLYIRGNSCTSSSATFNIGLFNASHSIVADNYCRGARVTPGTNNANGGYGIMIYKGKNGKEAGANVVTGNIVSNTQGTGIYLQSQPASSVCGNYIENSCQVQDDTSLLVAGIACNEGPCVIDGNVVVNSRKVGIAVQGEQFSVNGNTCTSTAEAGIEFRGCKRATVIGNALRDNCGGICTYDYRAGTQVAPTKDVTIGSNQIHSTHSQKAGLGLANISTSTAVGNEICEAGGPGVMMMFAARCSVGHNIIRDCGNEGILLYDAVYINVHGNHSTNKDTSSQKYGISEQASGPGACDHNNLVGNVCLDNVVAPILKVGSNSYQAGNRFSGGSLLVRVKLSAGTTGVITNPEIQTHDLVTIQRITPGNAPGELSYVAGAGTLSINSSNPADDGSVFYQVIH
jgi:Right handed beta helix region